MGDITRLGIQREGIVLGVGLAVVAAYLVGLAWAMQHAEYGVWGALALTPVLLLLIMAVVRVIARIENDALMTRIILAALALKVVGTIVRYVVTFDVYDKADADGYHRAGTELARLFRSGNFDIGNARLDGGRFLEIVTGILYTVIGPTIAGAFVVFSCIGFVGLYLLYRAFRIGVPEGDPRRYAVLVLCLPSMLYWPSSVGKEAWMCLAIGLTAYGAARLLSKPSRGGVVPLIAGLAAAAAVRPHMAMLLIGGLGVSYLFRRTSSPLGPVAKVAGLVLLVGVGLVALSRTESVLGLQGLSGSSVESVFNQTEQQTSGGGSGFSAVRVRTPLDLPAAAVTVVFRPFPTEAGNMQTLAASAEGMLLIGLFIAGRRRVLSLPSAARRRPYVMFALVYSLGFIVAFSSIANFGILTRQRVQVLPFVLLILALPAKPRRHVDSAPQWVHTGGS